jgi:murein DD-endopeptidase MepM/ murein hydrolase activator NlpD
MAMPVASFGTQQAIPMTNVDRMTAADRAASQLLPSGRVHPVWGKPGLSDTFGAARSGGRKHQGIDIFAEEGTPVLATTPGTVTRGAYNNSLGGTSFGFEDDQGNYHYYTHLSQARNIAPGTRLAAGDVLGYVGRTGNAANTPPHLHYSINEGRGSVINAYWYLMS